MTERVSCGKLLFAPWSAASASVNLQCLVLSVTAAILRSILTAQLPAVPAIRPSGLSSFWNRYGDENVCGLYLRELENVTNVLGSLSFVGKSLLHKKLLMHSFTERKQIYEENNLIFL